MCGISGIAGSAWHVTQLEAMVSRQDHRGPDACAFHIDPLRRAGLGHNRLSILDLSEAGLQPMASADGQVWVAFNGEIYNYLELKAELQGYRYSSDTDTEVILAAYRRWGIDCLHRFVGMFAFILWDEREGLLIAARDRFGVKPLFYHETQDGSLFLASEIKALHAAGIAAEPDPRTWATYLRYGLLDHSSRTFWTGIRSLEPGSALIWKDGKHRIWQWYDLAERVGLDCDHRPVDEVQEEYLALLEESVRLRFRADVPVGINLSGGLDSSALLGLTQRVQGSESDVASFTFVTGHDDYDELPWVREMLRQTKHASVVCELPARDVPELAESVQHAEDEPFGGLPTLAYARLFERAAAAGVKVLLDGQGMDEQWAGYDYYHTTPDRPSTCQIQGTRDKPVRPECLSPDFRALAEAFVVPEPFPDALRNAQYRDTRYTKIPRALRFNDRVSMRSSTELREPFLDHRVFELAFRQPPDRKVVGGIRKWMLRRAVQQLVPQSVVEAPKRPVQTPQREWLANDLRTWATDCIEQALSRYGSSWLHAGAVRAEWGRYCAGGSDNSYYVWQWISLGLLVSLVADRTPKPAPHARLVRSL